MNPFLPLILFVLLAAIVLRITRRRTEPAGPAQETIADLKARIRTLETILTDRDRQLRDEIDRLR